VGSLPDITGYAGRRTPLYGKSRFLAARTNDNYRTYAK
jgi:hypothetical protein